MSRRGKQLIYGIFYMALLALLVLLILPGSTGSREPACGGIIVENECVSDYEEVRLKLPPLLLKADKSYAALLALLENPNSDYGAREVEYEFQVSDELGNTIFTTDGFTALYPEESRYVHASISKETAERGMRARFLMKRVSWVGSAELMRPNLTIKNLKTAVKRNRITAEGSVKNENALLTDNAKVIAIIKDSVNLPLFAAETNLDRLRGFEEREFAVIFPESEELIKFYDASSTEAAVFGR